MVTVTAFTLITFQRRKPVTSRACPRSPVVVRYLFYSKNWEVVTGIPSVVTRLTLPRFYSLVSWEMLDFLPKKRLESPPVSSTVIIGLNLCLLIFSRRQRPNYRLLPPQKHQNKKNFALPLARSVSRSSSTRSADVSFKGATLLPGRFSR